MSGYRQDAPNATEQALDTLAEAAECVGTLEHMTQTIKISLTMQSVEPPATVVIEIAGGATVDALKEAIQESQGVARDRQALVFRKAVLEDGSKFLEDCGIEDGSTIVLLVPEQSRPVQILTASRDNTAKIWDAATGECKHTFCGHSDDVNSAVFSADALSLLTASDDETAKIWGAATGECKRTFTGHSGLVSSAVFSADALSVLTAGDKTAKIWEVSTGECNQTFSGHSATVKSAVFSAKV